MFKLWKTDQVSTWVLIIIAALLVEVTFFDGGRLFSILFSSILVYIGYRIRHRFAGKVLLFIGGVSLVMSILSMFTFQLLILVAVVMIIREYFQSRKSPETIAPVITTDDEPVVDEPLYKRQPIFLNRWFGHQETPSSVYEWQDIHIQHGIGDLTVDLSNTVLPDGESVISIRSGIGRVTLYIPYELDISLQHSAIIGNAAVLNHTPSRLLNERVMFETPGFREATQRVKILTSTWVGDLEVKRI